MWLFWISVAVAVFVLVMVWVGRVLKKRQAGNDAAGYRGASATADRHRRVSGL